MKKYKSLVIVFASLLFSLLVNILLQRHFFRIDLTTEKRYSISDNTKKLMSDLQQPVTLNIYLDGDLNSGFLRLKNSLRELLDEFSIYASKDFNYNFINPSSAKTEEERYETYLRLASRGMNPTTIYERDSEGKSIQKIVFPWVEIITQNDTFPVNLLKNVPGNSGVENLNISIENLEYELTDALRILNTKSIKKVAFIEGHGELFENFVYDASLAFSRYFQVDRGVLGDDACVLDDYEAIIIANPLTEFSESDKFIIDQYIMNGGKVLWFIDGVSFSFDELSEIGISPIIDKNLNLSDMLFCYGIRINPILLQDVQCLQMPINVSGGPNPQYESRPWFYSPLLLPNPMHAISRNITQVKADFCSSIDFISGNDAVSKTILLTTSTSTHQQTIPSMIDLREMPSEDDNGYFNKSFIPVAAILEGEFNSAFTNRLVPEGIARMSKRRNKSVDTRMLVVADGDIIKNDTEGLMGFDRYSGVQFGNKDFVLNALLYLTDEANWFHLKNRTFKIRMLNKTKIYSYFSFLKWANIVFPILLLFLCGGFYLLIRYFRYKK